MKINVYVTESYTTWVVKESIEIDTENYPELEGKTEDEIKDYIRENCYEMKPTNENWYGDLGEELSQQDIRRDKVYDEDMSVMFDDD